MALKKLSAPIGLIPSWANNDDLVDPPEVWDGTPSKVEPGAGKRDLGWNPKEKPEAQHLSKLISELGQWVQYLSTIQVMNWFDSGLIGGANSTGEALTYDEGIQSWLFGGRADTLENSRDGWTFFTFASGTGQTWETAVSKPPEDTPVHTGARTLFIPRGSLATHNVIEFSGGFATEILPSAFAFSNSDTAIWDGINSLWIIGGDDDSGGTPFTVFWTDATPISGFTKQTPAAAATSTGIVDMCHGEDGSGGALNLALGNFQGGSFDVYTSTNGTTWSPATPTGINAGEDARSCMYDKARGVFVLLTNKGCYTSTNGTSWTNVSGVIGGEFQFRCVANDGGAIYVTASDFGEPTGIRYSNDGGVTWRFIPVPPSENGSTDPIHAIHYAKSAGRFGLTWVDGPPTPTASANFSMSLAVGENPYSINALAFDPPDVT